MVGKVDRNTKRSGAGRFIASLGALASIWPAGQVVRYPHRSDTEALRSDAVRIGDDMRRVIEREYAQSEAAQK